MSRNLTRRKDAHCKSNVILRSANSTSRDALYKKIESDIRNFNYLDQKDQIFVLRIVIHKVQEGEFKNSPPRR